MPKLYFAGPSPYSAKVRICAQLAGVAVEEITVDTNVEPPELLAVNPLGKIPALVTDEGEAIFDSRVITQYLNRSHGGRLFPRNAAKRLDAERLEAIADGIADCLLAHVYERRFRPAEIVHQPWLDRQWGKAMRGLDFVAASPPRLGKTPNAGHVALRSVLAYLDFRFAGQWEKGRAKLRRWAAKFDARFPELVPLLPR